MELSQQELKSFEKQGYLVKKNVFVKAEIERLKLAVEKLQAIAAKLAATCTHKGSYFVIDKNNDQSQIKRVVWAGAAEPELLTFGRDHRLTQMAAQILESKTADHLINQVHLKLPDDGVQFPWHQDALHRGYGTAEWKDINKKGSYVVIIVAIDPVNLENGPVQLIPGSHKHGFLNLEYDESEMGRLPDFLNPETAISVALDPGEALLMGPYLVHGSLPNTSSQPRRTFLNGYSYPGANTKQYPGVGSAESIRLL